MMRITIRVRPGASRPRVGGDHGGALVVAVAVPPVDGRATQAALLALAEALGLPARAVRLQAGARSRTKIVAIDAGAVEAQGGEAGLAARVAALRASR